MNKTEIEFNPMFTIIKPIRSYYKELDNIKYNILATAAFKKWKHKAVQYVSRDSSPEKFKKFVELFMQIANKKMFKIEPDYKHQLIYVTYKK